MAPSYANIFMSVFEDQAIASFPHKPDVWLRFIDDIFVVWTAGTNKFLEFMDFINSLHPNLKFTFDFSLSSVHFLDVTILKDQAGLISTDLYIKPTDTHQFLLSSSCHPGHIKRSIAYSQAFRILRICSDPQTAVRRCNDLATYLVQRGYNRRKVMKQINRARSNFSNPTDPPAHAEGDCRKVYFTVEYHPGLPDIGGILRKNMALLHCSSLLKRLIPHPLLLASVNPPTLKKYWSELNLNPLPVR